MKLTTKRSCALLLSCVLMNACSGSGAKETSQPGAQFKITFQSGEHLRLKAGGEVTPVAVNEASLREIETALAAKDEVGAIQLFGAGVVFNLPSGTEVLLIERGNNPFACRVRVLEGDHKNEAVWTDDGWLTR
jgi:hypothetical protein